MLRYDAVSWEMAPNVCADLSGTVMRGVGW